MAAIEMDEAAPTKGQRRKLHTARESVGAEIADRDFLQWLASQPAVRAVPDSNATVIVDTLWPLMQQGTLAIPRSGYLIRCGRGLFIVEPAMPYRTCDSEHWLLRPPHLATDTTVTS